MLSPCVVVPVSGLNAVNPPSFAGSKNALSLMPSTVSRGASAGNNYGSGRLGGGCDSTGKPSNSRPSSRNSRSKRRTCKRCKFQTASTSRASGALWIPFAGRSSRSGGAAGIGGFSFCYLLKSTSIVGANADISASTEIVPSIPIGFSMYTSTYFLSRLDDMSRKDSEHE